MHDPSLCRRTIGAPDVRRHSTRGSASRGSRGGSGAGRQGQESPLTPRQRGRPRGSETCGSGTSFGPHSSEKLRTFDAAPRSASRSTTKGPMMTGSIRPRPGPVTAAGSASHSRTRCARPPHRAARPPQPGPARRAVITAPPQESPSPPTSEHLVGIGPGRPTSAERRLLDAKIRRPLRRLQCI